MVHGGVGGDRLEGRRAWSEAGQQGTQGETERQGDAETGRGRDKERRACRASSQTWRLFTGTVEEQKAYIPSRGAAGCWPYLVTLPPSPAAWLTLR